MPPEKQSINTGTASCLHVMGIAGVARETIHQQKILEISTASCRE